MNCKLLVIGLFLAAPPWAHSQAMDPATQALIERLSAKIDSLEKRVMELEQAKAAPQVTAPEPSLSAAAGATFHAHDTAPQPGAEPPVYPSLKISGFGDIDFSGTNLHGPNGGFGAQTLLQPHSGFQEGQFTVQLSSALSPKVTAFGELTLSGRADAGTGSPPAPGFNAEVERFLIRYDLNDTLKASFGRYHTPINYWNTAFHHGQWLQTTISRPEMVQFGGSFIPVHFVGALVEGVLPTGGLNLNYSAGLGNGRGAVISRPGDLGSINNNRAWLVNAFIRPNAPYGLQIGGSVYRDELNQLNAPAGREWIQSGHIVWAKETPELIAEFANVSHQIIGTGAVSNSQAFYVQTAYRLPGLARFWKPYYRFEYTHVPLADVNFRAVPSFSASTAGLRYDISSFAAFKLEYRHYERRNLPKIDGAFVQTSFTF